MTCQQCEAKDRELTELRREYDRLKALRRVIESAVGSLELMPATRVRQVKIITEAGRAIAAGATAKALGTTVDKICA